MKCEINLRMEGSLPFSKKPVVSITISFVTSEILYGIENFCQTDSHLTGFYCIKNFNNMKYTSFLNKEWGLVIVFVFYAAIAIYVLLIFKNFKCLPMKFPEISVKHRRISAFTLQLRNPKNHFPTSLKSN